jgi:hypothetical protein
MAEMPITMVTRANVPVAEAVAVASTTATCVTYRVSGVPMAATVTMAVEAEELAAELTKVATAATAVSAEAAELAAD